MAKNVVVIGGGIIGLCSAYYLRKEGHDVTVVDQSSLDGGASYVNAGYLAPSHLIPLAAPGVMRKGIKWMFDPSSPLYIKPRMNSDLLKWALAFNRSCSPKHVEKAIPVIKDIALLSQDLYDDLAATDAFTFHYEKKGLFMLCKTEKMLKEELHVAGIASDQGLDVREVTPEEIQKAQPNAPMDIIGGTFYLCDSHTTPEEFMTDMKACLKNMGVRFNLNERVTDLSAHNREIQSISTDKHELIADEYVLAAGSWSNMLSEKLGLKLLLQAGKGYRINTERPTGIEIPSILAEAKVAITPMNGFTRFGGTMEIAGINNKINAVRVAAIAKAVQNYFPEVIMNKEEKAAAACGLRPVTPDGLPYIGKSEKCSNLTIATGHAMMGWSMATATGKMVSEIISEQRPSLSLAPFDPDRGFK